MTGLRVNQILWFWKDGQGRGKLPEPGFVYCIHDENTVDLWIFCQHGAQRIEEKVAVRQDDDTAPLVRYATFKPTPTEPPAQGKESVKK